MKMNRLALSAMIAGACISGSAFGQTNRTAAPRYSPASYYSYYDDASTGPAVAKASTTNVVQASAVCDTKQACDTGNGAGAGGCDNTGGLGAALGGRAGCDLGNGCLGWFEWLGRIGQRGCVA